MPISRPFESSQNPHATHFLEKVFMYPSLTKECHFRLIRHLVVKNLMEVMKSAPMKVPTSPLFMLCTHIFLSTELTCGFIMPLPDHALIHKILIS
jgi:hypothetical protein